MNAKNDSDDEGFAELLSEAETDLKSVEESLSDVDDLKELGNDELESLLGDVDTLARVARETGELIEALDLSELPSAVDAGELLEAIKTGEIPGALSEEETGPGDVIDFAQVFQALDLLNAWDATDLVDIWEEKRELEAAVDDLADEGEDASMVEKAASAVADEGDELVDDAGELVETGTDAAGAAKEALGKPDIEDDPKVYQTFIQQQAKKGIDAFRDALLVTHEKFEKLHEANREKMRRQDMTPSSRNPTAVSTMATNRRDLGGGACYSTVPKKVKLSTAPAFERVYGRRFEIERERRKKEQ